MGHKALLLVAGVIAVAACGPRLIPGTDINDSTDSRAIVGVIEAYRQGVEKRDAAAVLALVSSTYFDDAGTPDPADDMDRAQLEQALPADYAKTAAAKLEVTVRTVNVDGNRATAEVFFDAHYRVTTPRGEVPKQVSDVHRFAFVREGGAWKIASGL